MRKNVGIDQLARGAGAGRQGFERLGPGKIAGRRGNPGDAVAVFGAEVVALGGLRGGARRGKRRQYCHYDLAHWNTASGLSRLSEPSNATSPNSSTAITRSRLRVWSTRRSMAACTTALRSALPLAIIWS